MSAASNRRKEPDWQPTGLEGRGNDLPASFYGPDIGEIDWKHEWRQSVDRFPMEVLDYEDDENE